MKIHLPDGRGLHMCNVHPVHLSACSQQPRWHFPMTAWSDSVQRGDQGAALALEGSVQPCSTLYGHLSARAKNAVLGKLLRPGHRFDHLVCAWPEKQFNGARFTGNARTHTVTTKTLCSYKNSAVELAAPCPSTFTPLPFLSSCVGLIRF